MRKSRDPIIPGGGKAASDSCVYIWCKTWTLPTPKGMGSVFFTYSLIQKFQVEQLLGVGTSHLSLVVVADGQIVEPIRRLAHGLVGVICGEHDAVGPGLQHGAQQSGGVAIPAGGDVEVILQIVREGLLRLTVPLVAVPPVADVPDLEGQELAHVANHDLQIGETVKQAADH